MTAPCAFPDCTHAAATQQGTCSPLHARVWVTGSWVNDKHGDAGHG